MTPRKLAVGCALAVLASAGVSLGHTYNGHSYEVTYAGSWSEAEAQAVAAGGHLVTINDAQENAWLVAEFGHQTYWIGFLQAPGAPEPDQGWEWISGDPVTLTSWRDGQPNEYLPGDDYAVMNNTYDGGPAPWGYWDDVPHDGWPGPVQGIVEIVPEPEPEYTWYVRGDSRYALTEPMPTWQDCENEAVAQGGHLVTVNDAGENAWLLETFGPQVKHNVWIGFFQPPGTGEPAEGWQWVSGEPVTYTDWGPGQPNEIMPGDDFAAMDTTLSTGTWHDVGPEGWDGPHPGIIEVPEPATMALLALGACLPLRRRRQ